LFELFFCAVPGRLFLPDNLNDTLLIKRANNKRFELFYSNDLHGIALIICPSPCCAKHYLKNAAAQHEIIEQPTAGNHLKKTI